MTNDAAVKARQEEQQLTDIAQMSPGHSAQALEMLVNPNLAPGLRTAFEAAANSLHFQQQQAVYIQQLDDKVVAKQAQEEKAEHDRQEQAWLETMTPEYRQAYADLQATVADAHKEYDHLRQELIAQRQQLDATAKEIDDNALHLSDGSRAYRDAQGKLVDKDGKELTGKDAEEAKTLLAQHPGPVALQSDYANNQRGIGANTRLMTRVNTEQADADRVGKKAGEHGYKTPAELTAERDKIHKRLAATESSMKAGATEKQANQVSMDALSDLGGPAPSTAAPHSSYASQLDPNAGIHANGVTSTFNAATQSVAPQAAPATTPPKPNVALPSPA